MSSKTRQRTVGRGSRKPIVYIERVAALRSISYIANFQRRRRMTEHAMPDTAPNTADLFEIIRTTLSMRRLKPDPVPNELIQKILEAGVCAPSGGKQAALGVPVNPRSE